ncbi:MAG: TIGR01777 family protein [Flavobacteriales bacterium]|nr:TIGR01777 family protein [Flavobacteriales bacterium]
MKKPKIVIAGGSGFFGAYLVNYYKQTKNVIVLTRGASEIKEGVEYVSWDGKSVSGWKECLNEAEALINLSGKSINCRFTDENKKLLIASRTVSTKVLAEAISSLENPPKIWLNASAGAMYQPQTQPNTENETEFSIGFLSKMALTWEEAFYKEELPKTKRAAIRISLILGKDGGVFPVLKKITSLYLGGSAGSGKQMMSWIHIEDAARAIDFIIEKNIEGPVNFSSNSPVSNKVFMKSLRKVLGVSLGIPAPAFGIKFFSRFIGAEPSLLLDSVNFIPEKLIEEGFKFKFTDINNALEDLK